MSTTCVCPTRRLSLQTINTIMRNPIPTCPPVTVTTTTFPTSSAIRVTNVNVNVNVNKLKKKEDSALQMTPTVAADSEIDQAALEQAVSDAIRSAIDRNPG